jgi:hypothetical protein
MGADVRVLDIKKSRLVFIYFSRSWFVMNLKPSKFWLPRSLIWQLRHRVQFSLTVAIRLFELKIRQRNSYKELVQLATNTVLHCSPLAKILPTFCN